LPLVFPFRLFRNPARRVDFAAELVENGYQLFFWRRSMRAQSLSPAVSSEKTLSFLIAPQIESRTARTQACREKPTMRAMHALLEEILHLESSCRACQRSAEREAANLLAPQLREALTRVTVLNTHLRNVLQQVFLLEKNLEDAHAEYTRLARERDTLAERLARAEDR
jgi:chromosome segregation ATPase